MPENGHNKALKLFYSYSHRDEKLRDELETHLRIMHHQGLIESWHDRRIIAGQELEKHIDKNLNNADIIILLVSADFIASHYCYDIEMVRAIERHDKGEAVVIPIIIRKCKWKSAPFGKLMALPEDGKPVSRSTRNARDSAWLEVADGIEKVIKNFTKKAEQTKAKPKEEKKADKKEETPTVEKETKPDKIEIIYPPDIPKKIICKKDGAPMVLIPAGKFEMGDNDFTDAKPVHTVYIDAFYMDVYEVTNEQYKKFMDATGYKAPAYWDDKDLNNLKCPVVGVSWEDANAYCIWAGKRLPTEAEWEKAARGGSIGKKFPWGDKLTYNHANIGGTSGRDKWKFTSPVGSFPPNRYGLYDIVGNVWEWCRDWYDDHYEDSQVQNPPGPSIGIGMGISKVMRGGSYMRRIVSELRVSGRYYGVQTRTYNEVGFRCAKDI